MKKNVSPNGRKHGIKSRPTASDSRLKTTLTLDAASQAYHWTTDRGRSRLVVKH